MDLRKEDKHAILGENIRRNRKKINYSQEQLAKAINVSVATISSYETGKTAPSVKMAIKLTQIFHISLNELYFHDPENQFPYKNASF